MSQKLRIMLDKHPMTLFQWGVVGICVMLNMIDGFDVLVMAFTASAVSSYWQLSGVQLGFLLSAGLFGMAIGSLLLAPWADKLGRRPLILACLVLSGFSMLGSAWSQTPTQLAVQRLITGLGVGGVLACTSVIASEYASLRWRSLAITLLSVGYAIGASIGGSIAVWLLSKYDWRAVFMFGGICTLTVFTVSLFALPESLDFLLARRPNNALQRLNALMRKMGCSTFSALPVSVLGGTIKPRGPLKLLSAELLRPTLLIWFSFFIVMYGYYFVMGWTPKLLAASGLTAEQGVTSGVLLSFGGIWGSVLLGLLATRFAIHRALAVFMLITAVLLYFLVGSSGSLWVSYTLAFFIGAFANGSMAGLYVIAPMVYDSEVRATGVGWGIGIGRIGAIISPLVAGNLLDAAWTPSRLYVAYGMTFALAAILVSLHRIGSPGNTRISSPKGGLKAH